MSDIIENNDVVNTYVSKITDNLTMLYDDDTEAKKSYIGDMILMLTMENEDENRYKIEAYKKVLDNLPRN